MALKVDRECIRSIDLARMKHEADLYRSGFIVEKPKYLLHMFRPAYPAVDPVWMQSIPVENPSDIPRYVQMYLIERLKYD